MPDDRLPPEPDVSWGEVFTIIRITFEVLALPFAMLAGALAMVIMTWYFLFTQPVLLVIPASIAGLGLWLLIRRDRRMQAEMQAEIEQGRIRERPGRGNLFR